MAGIAMRRLSASDLFLVLNLFQSAFQCERIFFVGKRPSTNMDQLTIMIILDLKMNLRSDEHGLAWI